MALTVNTNIVNDTDQYLLDAKNVKGTYVVVTNVTERNALPTATLMKGSLCYCQEDSKFYQYNGSSWTEAKLGGADSPIIAGAANNSAVLSGEYEGYSNKAISQISMALGAASTAGLKGWYYSGIDFTNHKIYLSKTQPNSIQTSNFTTDTSITIDDIQGPKEGLLKKSKHYQVGHKISIVCNAKYENCATIKKVEAGIITVDSLPFTADNLPTYLFGAGKQPDDFTIYSIVDETNATTKELNVYGYCQGGIDLGGGALAEGVNTYAVNIGAHTEGVQTIAYGQYSHAEGFKTEAAYAAHAEGKEAKASGPASHAEGIGAEATGQGAHGEGLYTHATGNGAHAEGSNTHATTSHAHAEGYDTHAESQAAHAEGYSTYAQAKATHTEGTLTYATQAYAHAEGQGSQATREASHAEGFETITNGMYSHAEGSKSKTGGHGAHAEGTNAKSTTTAGVVDVFEQKLAPDNTTYFDGPFADGRGAHAEGAQTLAWGYASHAEGCQTEALEKMSHAEGDLTVAKGHAAHAEGFNTKASSEAAHAEGYKTWADSQGAHAEGTDNGLTMTDIYKEGSLVTTKDAAGNTVNLVVKGPTSWNRGCHAEGICTFAASNGSHSEGVQTQATGTASHAEGNQAVAYGAGSHAEGQKTRTGTKEGVGGSYAHAEGDSTAATGQAAHAEGYLTVATGNYSHAAGEGTKATVNAQTVVGKYNAEDADALFIVGNGESASKPSNAFVVKKDGTTVVSKSHNLALVNVGTANDLLKLFSDHRTCGVNFTSTVNIDNNKISIPIYSKGYLTTSDGGDATLWIADVSNKKVFTILRSVTYTGSSSTTSYSKCEIITKDALNPVIQGGHDQDTVCIMVGGRTSNEFTVQYATTATNLSAKPYLAESSSTQIKLTAGGKTSDAFTVPYATTANSLGLFPMGGGARNYVVTLTDGYAEITSLPAGIYAFIIGPSGNTTATVQSGHSSGMLVLADGNTSVNPIGSERFLYVQRTRVGEKTTFECLTTNERFEHTLILNLFRIATLAAG
jgi:hypothetical protein